MSLSSMEQKMQTVIVRQKMSTLDEEGRLRQFDIREDPEQKEKCDQTMELLLAAGYFRVRIKGLSEFDKVVGGLAWSIQACNFTVDIDVLYQENATLGQKISLTERIVLVLSRMKCPHPIEPHQIQGGDFIHIFPVVQWLVKRVFERRADIGDFNRAYTINQYDKQFGETIDEVQYQQSSSLKQNVEAVRIRHRPKRRYRCLDRKTARLNNPDECRKRIHSTLVEFGQAYQLLTLSNNHEKPQEDVNILIKNMVNEKSKITTQIVHTLVNQQQDTLREIIEDFEEKEKARLEEALLSENGQQQLAIRTFKIQLNKQTEKINTLQNLIEQTKIQKEEKRNLALEIKQEYEQLNTELEQIEARTKDIDSESLKHVETLVAEYETIKKQEQERRATYKNQKNELEQEITQLQARLQSSSDIDTEENEKMKQIEEQYQLVADRLQNQRLTLAKKVREISAISRHIDDIPTPIEVAQYRQAFFQLYNQSAVLYRQTKQNYTLYNTFTDMINYMEKEITLIESIYQGYPQAIQSQSGKDNFLKQLENIVESVKQSRFKIEQRRQEEKSKRDALNIQLAQLVDKARQYTKVLKDFQEVIRENEYLTSRSE
ncbi:unnamed protein product [Rotaria sp. Silwood1]|nr:unnamed protein product [Rotaria sp. Silwood1]CAF3328581.1 unnamed protein product [Rotaria sp. Silwood1]CAF3337222.1 unnamed protein product [Rotaria sp. Silwood1]CAF3347877.1 unnamed protein product [Rotaria sp. Silwood1]CAF3351903.1 unnamed protein product [Rotaria sp. Silwood1]